jgi:acylphosphatase
MGAGRSRAAAPVSGAVTCRRVVVSGRVQGVFFRDTCRREAVAAGLAGWIQNLHTGQVEAWFEGEATAVERLVAWCHHGPRRADVTAVDVYEEPPRGARGFAVR